MTSPPDPFHQYLDLMHFDETEHSGAEKLGEALDLLRTDEERQALMRLLGPLYAQLQTQREALLAYRSALRSREPETEQLRALARAALDATSEGEA